MNQVKILACPEVLSKARELAKHTIANLYCEIDNDDILTGEDAEIICHCVKIILEVNKSVSESVSAD